MGIFRQQKSGLFGRDRYEASSDSETCEHPRQSAENRVLVDRKGRSSKVVTIAYCLDCGMEWGA